MKRKSFFVFGVLTVAAMFAGCANQVTEGPARESSTTYGPSHDTTVEEPSPVYIPQKPGTTTDSTYQQQNTEPNNLQHNTPDQQLYNRGQ
jgi:DMSO/TMAO reductase YedYZ molybdopterin-dependent catalytic subunit